MGHRWLVAAYWAWNKYLTDIEMVGAEGRARLESEQRLRQQERVGRIAAEKKIVALVQALQQHEQRLQPDSTADSNASTSISPDAAGIDRRAAHDQGAPEHWRLMCIGHIRSCFKKRHGACGRERGAGLSDDRMIDDGERPGCPRQGSIAPASRGVLVLSARVSEHSLQSLEQYSHVWLTFVFHANTNMSHCAAGDGIGVRAKIKPPRLGSKVGVYATRSPHRYNPIGLTLARVERVEGREIHLSAIDLIEGTPILDVRPYIPAYDTVPIDSVRVPAWIDESPDHPPLDGVVVSDAAWRSLEELESAREFEFFTRASDVRSLIEQVLRPDVRSSHRRKVGHDSDEYEVFLDRLRVVFTISDATRVANVVRIELAAAESPAASSVSATSSASPSISSSASSETSSSASCSSKEDDTEVDSDAE